MYGLSAQKMAVLERWPFEEVCDCIWIFSSKSLWLKNHHSHIITRLNLYQKKNNHGRRSLSTAFVTSVCWQNSNRIQLFSTLQGGFGRNGQGDACVKPTFKSTSLTCKFNDCPLQQKLIQIRIHIKSCNLGKFAIVGSQNNKMKSRVSYISFLCKN